MDIGEGDEMKIVDERLKLLVKKYSGKATYEDLERIDELTEEIRKLDPRVVQSEIDRLKAMAARLLDS